VDLTATEREIDVVERDHARKTLRRAADGKEGLHRKLVMTWIRDADSLT
jgi:hypothetical protein